LNKKYIVFLVLALSIGSQPVAKSSDQHRAAGDLPPFCDYPAWRTTSFAITANTLEQLKTVSDRDPGTAIKEVNPEVSYSPNMVYPPKTYLQYDSALGNEGPLGSMGPLGVLGPIGRETWNPAGWISFFSLVFGDAWEVMFPILIPNTAPFGIDGPLGINGPLTSAPYCRDLAAINSFGKHLQAGGVWSSLGPLGTLGPLGPLGALGPAGEAAVIYRIDQNGQYIDVFGNVARTQTIRHASGIPYRTYDLYENYQEEFAKNMNDNDTSFMVMGTLATPSEIDNYPFISNVDQYVSVVIVPVNIYDNFKLTVSDLTGRTYQSVDTLGRFVNNIQIRVQAGTRLKASVIQGDARYMGEYRLFVIGSTEYINGTDITGLHQIN
jgi:hypothetical protein